MLGRFRNALYSAMGTPEGETPPNVADIRSRIDSVSQNVAKIKVKYAYQRPIFLQLFSDDEIQVTADHMVRPIMVPRDVQILPWFTGYAEAINAGKSVRNEDQAAFHRGVLRTKDADSRVQFVQDYEIPYVYFGIFDGHAGSGCAVTAANELHQVPVKIPNFGINVETLDKIWLESSQIRIGKFRWNSVKVQSKYYLKKSQ